MKKIILGTIVGTLIFFSYQSIMWMGGFHKDLWNYSPNQDVVLQSITTNLTKDGLYHIPSVDPGAPDLKQQEEKLMEENVGKPWAMVFYHSSMHGFEPGYILMGIWYSFVACLIVCLVLYSGGFGSFGSRFLVCIGFGLFALAQGVMDEMNWWAFPWSFIKPQVIDLTFGWGLTSLWLAGYVKKKG
jgi:hypothetical protein